MVIIDLTNPGKYVNFPAISYNLPGPYILRLTNLATFEKISIPYTEDLSLNANVMTFEIHDEYKDCLGEYAYELVGTNEEDEEVVLSSGLLQALAGGKTFETNNKNIEFNEYNG